MDGQDRRPKYVRELDLRARCAEARLAGLEEGIVLLRRYLSSPKFHTNTRVEVADVFNRLDDAGHYANEREAEVPR